MQRIIAATVTVFLFTACYHATIETGLTPSTQTVEKHWAAGWIYGLVPPSNVETMARCPNGVARVETQLSFTNQLVNMLTLGIYTPMDITVTCAATRTGTLPVVRDIDQAHAVQRAVALSLVLGQPVEVQAR